MFVAETTTSAAATTPSTTAAPGSPTTTAAGGSPPATTATTTAGAAAVTTSTTIIGETFEATLTAAPGEFTVNFVFDLDCTSTNSAYATTADAAKATATNLCNTLTVDFADMLVKDLQAKMSVGEGKFTELGVTCNGAIVTTSLAIKDQKTYDDIIVLKNEIEAAAKNKTMLPWLARVLSVAQLAAPSGVTVTGFKATSQTTAPAPPSSDNTALIAGICGGVGGLILIGVIIYFVMKKPDNNNSANNNGGDAQLSVPLNQVMSGSPQASPTPTSLHQQASRPPPPRAPVAALAIAKDEADEL